MILLTLCLLATQSTSMPHLNASKLDAYDVVWTTPSKDAAGSMPIGNGEVVLNAWMEESSGDLLFYIARTDALSEICRILKLGQVRVHLDPNPFKDATDFKQHLHLHDGRIEISGGGANLNLFVDSSSQDIQILGKTAQPTQVTANIECWRNAPRTLPKEEKGSAWAVHDAPFKLVESGDVFVTGEDTAVTWYHRNETTVVPQLLENQSLTGLKGTFDPLIHRTFGGRLSGDGFVRGGERTLRSSRPSNEFHLYVTTHTAQTPTANDWLREVKSRAAKASSAKSALESTERWWHAFWDRSWVFTDGDGSAADASLTQGYVLQRYVQACQGRGEYPIKFNGGYYTVEPKAMGKSFNADWRNWGDCHWFQNVRHMYHPMLESGDFEMMEPFFRLYEAARPLAESRTKKYHNVEGAYFPETMTVFGTYSGGDYGWDRQGKEPKEVDCPWWQYAWNQGPELLDLMLDYWDYTRDTAFLKRRLLPMATSVLTYFGHKVPEDGEWRDRA